MLWWIAGVLMLLVLVGLVTSPRSISTPPTGSEPSIQLLLSQAASGSLATTMTPWMDLVIALRTVFKAVELASPAPFKPVPLIAATIAFFNVSIFGEFPEC